MQANLADLNESAKLAYIPDLIARKTAGSEHELLSDSEKEFHGREFVRLRVELELARSQSFLPEAPSAQKELNSMLISLRLGAGA